MDAAGRMFQEEGYDETPQRASPVTNLTSHSSICPLSEGAFEGGC